MALEGWRSKDGAQRTCCMTDDRLPFWRAKKMSEMTAREWESLCDGCGRCCLNKLTDVDTGETVYTDVGCKLLDGESCRCTDYKNRQAKVRDCVRLTPRNVKRLTWLPPTCAYRLVGEGRDLPWWHPLVSGDAETVHTAGISVRGKVAASEKDVPDERLVDFIVSWPGKWPKGAKGKGPGKGQEEGPIAALKRAIKIKR
jgi:uncharacterized cysteine cluster protein YcgN (CxxCxxCC family)